MNRYPSVLISSSADAAVNLAFEEMLMARLLPGQEILFLCENDPAVVIGRFQNPWKECRTGLAESMGVPVYRRISGGGTVVHGPGNLNFSVISATKVPDKAGNLDRVVRALGNLGLDIFRNDRFDLRMRSVTDEGIKVSGSAFRQTAGASMHHATLLVNADLAPLKVLLHQTGRNMEVRGVASVPSPVGNLSDLFSGLEVADVIKALAAEWGADPILWNPHETESDNAFTASHRKLLSSEWIWGRTPVFRETFTDLPGYPGGTISLQVKAGQVEDAPDAAVFLEGVSYRGPDFRRAAGLQLPGWVDVLASRVDGDG